MQKKLNEDEKKIIDKHMKDEDIELKEDMFIGFINH